MKICLVSPYHGGSHRGWAEGYRSASRHEIELLTLPGRFWKWRMHGGALTLARQFCARKRGVDLIVATDMLDLTTFLALTRGKTFSTPAILYMHENQLTYPLPSDGRLGPMRRQLGERDRHYAFINFAAMRAADQIVFNSSYHRDALFGALPVFLRHFPEYREEETIPELRRRAEVLPVGIDLAGLSEAGAGGVGRTDPPLVLWNQRWEYDKNPGKFFTTLSRAADAGLNFRLALCGERFARQPVDFRRGIDRLGSRIIHVGYLSRDEYARLLHQADVVLSVADHEFFGVSVVEAAACGALPLVPDRLSYPELIPIDLRPMCLFRTEDGLDRRLRWALTASKEVRSTARRVAQAMEAYDWFTVAPRYDSLFEQVAQSQGSG